jgi:regulator of protease activity HflC (stomatin/prohibitin superfamily)
MHWQRGVLFSDGRFARVLEPGRQRCRWLRSRVEVVDLRRRDTVVPGQELLTADGAGLRVSALVQWWVADPFAFVTAATEVEAAVRAAVQVALRDAVTALTFEQVVTERGRLTGGLAEAAAPYLTGLGVTLGVVVVRDVMLPAELRRAATETLLAREQGRAELERARAEAASLRTLPNAALLRLRTIQAAASPGTTLVLTDGTRPQG